MTSSVTQSNHLLYMISLTLGYGFPIREADWDSAHLLRPRAAGHWTSSSYLTKDVRGLQGHSYLHSCFHGFSRTCDRFTENTETRCPKLKIVDGVSAITPTLHYPSPTPAPEPHQPPVRQPHLAYPQPRESKHSWDH